MTDPATIPQREWLYGNLQPRNTGFSTGQSISYAQSGSYGAPGLDTTGYVYVPKGCSSGGSGTRCKLHVALHGCEQSYSTIGNKFMTNTGYTQWADTNGIIVLFPQAIADETMHTIWNGMSLPNPLGCFDWVGWYGGNDDQIGGMLPAIPSLFPTEAREEGAWGIETDVFFV